MMVLDACAAVEIVRQTDEGRVLEQFMQVDELVASCDLARAEVASVFRKIARVRHLDAKTVERYYSEAIALVDEFYPMQDLQVEALRESIRLDHSVYDMFYFVLARRTGATLLTVDRKLADLCLAHGVDCIMQVELPN